jgi:hypothetical protein
LAGGGAEQLDGGGDGLVEVGEEVACGGVEELESGDVRRGDVAGAGGAVEDRRVQGPAQQIGAEDVQAARPDERRSGRHAVQNPLDRGPDLVRAAPPLAGGAARPA